MSHLNRAAAITGISIIKAARFCSAWAESDIIRNGDSLRRRLVPGDVVEIAPEVKHWHGAAPDSWFSHIAIEVPAEGSSNEWCEEVSDEEYKKAVK